MKSGVHSEAINRWLVALAASLVLLSGLAEPSFVSGFTVDGDVSRFGVFALNSAQAAFWTAALILLVVAHQELTQSLVFKTLIFSFPLWLLCVVVFYKAALGARDYEYLWLIREDGPVEWATAGALMFAALFYFILACRLSGSGQILNRCVGIFAAFALLLVTMEEISWGQRLIGFTTPQALSLANRQGEFNLHNIDFVEAITLRVAPAIISFLGVSGFLMLSALERTQLSKLIAPLDLRLFVPPWFASSYFVPLAVYSWMMYFAPTSYVWQDQEPAEFGMSLGVLVLSVSAFARGHSPATSSCQRGG